MSLSPSCSSSSELDQVLRRAQRHRWRGDRLRHQGDQRQDPFLQQHPRQHPQVRRGAPREVVGGSGRLGGWVGVLKRVPRAPRRCLLVVCVLCFVWRAATCGRRGCVGSNRRSSPARCAWPLLYSPGHSASLCSGVLSLLLHCTTHLSPQAAFYILQHSKTMGLRFRQQCKTAQAVAEMLEAHEKVRTGTCLHDGCAPKVRLCRWCKPCQLRRSGRCCCLFRCLVVARAGAEMMSLAPGESPP